MSCAGLRRRDEEKFRNICYGAESGFWEAFMDKEGSAKAKTRFDIKIWPIF